MAKTRQQLSEERAIRLELFSSFFKREFVDYLAALWKAPIVPNDKSHNSEFRKKNKSYNSES
jgi:hypothetical protein